MDRLSILLTLVTGAVTTGALVTVVLTLGWVAWGPILGAVVIGWLLAWPVAYRISRRIKRRDPQFDHGRSPQSVIPDPDAPEV
jgi:membrane associated rhomboid family serine protease